MEDATIHGLEMTPSHKGTRRTSYTASIDRLDSDIGYTEGNVVWCCYFYNIAKNNLREDEFLELCKKLADYQNKL